MCKVGALQRLAVLKLEGGLQVLQYPSSSLSLLSPVLECPTEIADRDLEEQKDCPENTRKLTSLGLAFVGGIFCASLGGSQTSPNLLETARISPEVPCSLSLQKSSATQRFPKVPQTSPEVPGPPRSSLKLSRCQPLSLGSLTPSDDSQRAL